MSRIGDFTGIVRLTANRERWWGLLIRVDVRRCELNSLDARHQDLPNYTELQHLTAFGRIVDFPDRHIAYVLWDCNQSDVERCVYEIVKTVEIHPCG